MAKRSAEIQITADNYEQGEEGEDVSDVGLCVWYSSAINCYIIVASHVQEREH